MIKKTMRLAVYCYLRIHKSRTRLNERGNFAVYERKERLGFKTENNYELVMRRINKWTINQKYPARL